MDTSADWPEQTAVADRGTMHCMDRPRFQFRLWMIFVLTALVGWGMVTVPYWFYEIPLQHSAQKSGQYRLYPPQPPRLSVLEVLRTQFGRLPEVSFALVIILVSFLGGMRAERWRTNRRTRLPLSHHPDDADKL